MKNSSTGACCVRLLKTLLGFYPVLLPVTIGCIVFNAVVGSLPSVFMQKVIALVEQSWQDGAWNAVGGQILRLVGLLAVFYLLSLAAGLAFNQLMAIITQGALKKLRVKMFGGMQSPERRIVKHGLTIAEADLVQPLTGAGQNREAAGADLGVERALITLGDAVELLLYAGREVVVDDRPNCSSR